MLENNIFLKNTMVGVVNEDGHPESKTQKKNTTSE